MSAIQGFGIDDLLKVLKKYLPEGELEYPEDQVLDRPMEYVITEMIREKCMRLLEDEVPHSIYIDLKQLDMDDDEERMEVYADIIVEKESEKAIVIGKNGRMISQISKYSEQAVSSYFGYSPCCDLRVKVIPDWRNSDKYLKKFGYEE